MAAAPLELQRAIADIIARDAFAADQQDVINTATAWEELDTTERRIYQRRAFLTATKICAEGLAATRDIPATECLAEPAALCPACRHDINTHAADPGGPCAAGGRCPCVLQPNEITCLLLAAQRERLQAPAPPPVPADRQYWGPHIQGPDCPCRPEHATQARFGIAYAYHAVLLHRQVVEVVGELTVQGDTPTRKEETNS